MLHERRRFAKKREREEQEEKAVFDVRVAVDAEAPVPSQSTKSLLDFILSLWFTEHVNKNKNIAVFFLNYRVTFLSKCQLMPEKLCITKQERKFHYFLLNLSFDVGKNFLKT